PAARLRGQLLDADKKPLVGYTLHLEGESYPATNVLAAQKTDPQGRFTFDSIPLTPYRLSLGSGRVTILSEPIPFQTPDERLIIATYLTLEAVLEWHPAPDAQPQSK
ncbi:carboxypeptidase-like regulatory domain-containing protein, partial [Singulisphaera rosea]